MMPLSIDAARLLAQLGDLQTRLDGADRRAVTWACELIQRTEMVGATEAFDERYLADEKRSEEYQRYLEEFVAKHMALVARSGGVMQFQVCDADRTAVPFRKLLRGSAVFLRPLPSGAWA